MLVLCMAASSAQKEKPYALIFITAYDTSSHSVYGLEVRVRRFDTKNARKKPSWSGSTDHNGQFAQRVPPGPADYIVWLEDTSNPRRDKHAVASAIAAAEKGDAHSAQEGS